MDAISKLEAIESIRHVKARYFRCMDCKLWDELRSVFTEGMTVLTPSGEIYSQGGATYVASLKDSLENSVSVHQAFTAEIDIVNADNAKAIWAMHDIMIREDRHPRQGWKSILGRGHYHDTYKREGECWRIDTLSLTRLRLDVEWSADDPRSQ